MKLRDYLKDKIIIIILVILTYFIILSFMIGFKIVDELRWCFTILYSLLFIIIFLYDFFRKYGIGISEQFHTLLMIQK